MTLASLSPSGWGLEATFSTFTPLTGRRLYLYLHWIILGKFYCVWHTPHNIFGEGGGGGGFQTMFRPLLLCQKILLPLQSHTSNTFHSFEGGGASLVFSLCPFIDSSFSFLQRPPQTTTALFPIQCMYHFIYPHKLIGGSVFAGKEVRRYYIYSLKKISHPSALHSHTMAEDVPSSVCYRQREQTSATRERKDQIYKR